jgi:hypothetical protein
LANIFGFLGKLAEQETALVQYANSQHFRAVLAKPVSQCHVFKDAEGNEM